ncbi:MAG: aminotransferase class I/II-fold pyridoxal phosphate-dependent enzyme [Deltaproteobacteria bacterium]|nr:aminotransferase class I/II-fold pyridoxal phosphate-dependent enzyme [Deltaproteobacteria bacterium]
MEVVASKRIRNLTGYAFAEVDRQVEKLREAGVRCIDFGVGDPTIPTPVAIREACKRGVDERARSGYPSYVGAKEYRDAVAAWMKRRFGVVVDPATEICSTIGSKEAVFHFAEAFVDPGDVVLIPSPGYPPFSRGTLFAEGRPYFYPLLAKNRFLPDLAAIPRDVARTAKVMWVNYPNNPTGATAPVTFFKEVVAYCAENNIILCSDEAYTELYYGEAPRSALEFGRDGVVAFHSLSKRSAMTTYRVGFVAGDKRIVDAFKKVKTNIDSGTATFVQDAAVAALADETHVAEMRADYRAKRDVLVGALKGIGLADAAPDATLYVWQPVPRGMTSVEFAKRLLAPEVALVTTPGAWVSDVTAEGLNPGEGFVRFALVPSMEETREAAERLKRVVLK